MADAPAAPAKGAGLDFLKQKVGPLPLGVWLLAAAGIWYYIQHKNAAAGSSQTANANTVDPNSPTGQTFGEELAAQAQQIADAGTGSGSTTAGQYADNASWGRAAVNYLVGSGIDPTVATQAIGNYLQSQINTTAEQADVNLAIQGIGPPPQIPGPSSTNPNPVVHPPVTTGPPPAPKPAGNVPGTVTGLHVTSTAGNSVSLAWTATKGATSYAISYGIGSKATTWHTTATGTGVTIGNLRGKTRYSFNVAAKPSTTGHSAVSATTK